MPLVLVVFALICTLPAAVVVPSAIAQEEDDEDEENLASGIASEVLDDGGETNQEQSETVDQTDSNEPTTTFDVDQDADAAAILLGLQLDEDEIVILPPPDDDDLPPEEPPEFVAFCYEIETFVHCYDTLEDCVAGGEQFGLENPECEGVETVPPGAADCEVLRDEEGEPVGSRCTFSPI